MLNTDSIAQQLDDALIARSPDPTNPCAPGMDCSGPVNRVTTMAKKLDRIDDFVNFTLNDIIDAVIVAPPDDNQPVLMALFDVRDSADAIATSANAFLINPPDDGIPPEFLGAVASVKNSAETLSTTADGFIQRILREVPTDP